jgi:voltage-gated potassium channel
MKQPPTPQKIHPLWRFKQSISVFCHTYLISLVVIFLVSSWLVISWLVYHVESKAEGANITTWGEGIWWGIVTFLTVGYGDRFPITTVGRIYGGLLMLAGVIAVGIVTAKISSYFLEQALRKERGLVDSNRLKDHFIVCGYKEEMDSLLAHILDFNQGLTADQVVLIANISQTVADTIRDQPRLKSLNIIIGEYYHEANLRRAAPERARKVLILADKTPTPTGQIPTMTEVDARTIMTSMTLSNIARGTLVAAELLDSKMDQYLRLASVSEIIYSREYSRLLLGNASGGTGISNIIFDLLSPDTPTVIVTKAIPDTAIGQKYGEFKRGYEESHPGCVAIGILENTGNSQRIKEMALRQAQKTPDVSKLVSNLRSVKAMKFNCPVFNPSNDYVINEGSMAIVIENRLHNQSGRGSIEESIRTRFAA